MCLVILFLFRLTKNPKLCSTKITVTATLRVRNPVRSVETARDPKFALKTVVDKAFAIPLIVLISY